MSLASFPPRIRTDGSSAFAHDTMVRRVPAIVQEVIDRNSDYPSSVLDALAELRDQLRGDRVLPAPAPGTPDRESWVSELAVRAGESWLATDWFFAETYAYRQIIERTGFFFDARDPFASIKLEEYQGAVHAEAFERALAIEGNIEQRLYGLLAAALFGNRIDLSFAASRARGTNAADDDWLTDDRSAAIDLLLGGAGPVHIVADNAGTELTLDLVLAEFVVEVLQVPVIVHLKRHPTFVSDAILDDVLGFPTAQRQRAPRSRQAHSFLDRLSSALAAGQIQLESDWYWNGPRSLWELPGELEQRFRGARLLLLKGDANYRRALGDAIWPPETPFARATEYFQVPLFALRTLKSEPIVGLAPGRAERLDEQDSSWRVNGRRVVASLGGRTSASIG